jgi:hypothetical protein
MDSEQIVNQIKAIEDLEPHAQIDALGEVILRIEELLN